MIENTQPDTFVKLKFGASETSIYIAWRKNLIESQVT